MKENMTVIPQIGNKHYIIVDDRGRIIEGWSDGPHPEKDATGAICINEQGSYQFRLCVGGEENPSLYTADGIPLYCWESDTMMFIRRSEEEIAADRAAIPEPPPTAQERMEAQVTYTAMMTDTLLEEG